MNGKRYGFDKTALCKVVRGLINDGAFIFENNQVIWVTLRDYEGASAIQGKGLDFADARYIETYLFNKVAESLET